VPDGVEANSPPGTGRYRFLLPLALLVCHTMFLTLSAAQNSPMVDEVAHLPAGIIVWKLGRFDLYRVNPPLAKSVAAMPAIIGNAKTDWSAYYESDFLRPEWAVGTSFIGINREKWFQWYLYARWAVIPFSVLGGMVCYLWAKELYGRGAGDISLTLWCFSPNVLAWGASITPDMAATAFGLLAGWRFWHWLKNPTLANVFLAGLSLGLAELAKMTWVILFFLWPVLWGLWHLVLRRPRSHTKEQSPLQAAPGKRLKLEAIQMLAILLFGVYVLNAGYAFVGSFQRLGDYNFGTKLFAGRDSILEGGVGGNRFHGTVLGALPVPFPREYIRGIDMQRTAFERTKTSYLNGEWKQGGWWYFYLEAAILKVPLGTWSIGLLVLSLTCFRPGWRTQWQHELILLAPAIAVLILLSLHTGFSRHFRYALPCLPFVFIWCSKAALAFQHHQRQLCVVVTVALTWSLCSSLFIYPHSVSYFNEIAGGPSGGHRFLLDSNLDWGQDLFYLKSWYDDHPDATPLMIDAHTAVGIEDFDMSDRNATEADSQWYAVSAHKLFAADGKYHFLKDQQPIGKAGYSIWIFRIPRGEQHSQ